jgi:ketosteroid isomerase-like protein
VTAGSDIAEQFVEALRAFDVDAMSQLLAPSFRRWINFTQQEEPATAFLGSLTTEKAILESFTVTCRRTATTESGFVLELTMTGRTKLGDDVTVPTCLIVDVADGAITRIAEYADTRQVKPLLAAMRQG